jgi:hypothetical protein
MSRQHDFRSDLGTVVRGLAYDAYDVLRRARGTDRDGARRLVIRVDRLMHELGDRPATELYRWLVRLRAELVRAARDRRPHFRLDDEGSGFHRADLGMPVGG